MPLPFLLPTPPKNLQRRSPPTPQRVAPCRARRFPPPRERRSGHHPLTRLTAGRGLAERLLRLPNLQAERRAVCPGRSASAMAMLSSTTSRPRRAHSSACRKDGCTGNCGRGGRAAAPCSPTCTAAAAAAAGCACAYCCCACAYCSCACAYCCCQRARLPRARTSEPSAPALLLSPSSPAARAAADDRDRTCRPRR